MPNGLDSDQDRHSVGPDLDPNHLQRLLADDKSCSELDQMGLDVRKPVLGGLRTTQAQNLSSGGGGLRTAPLLFTFWKVSYVNLLQVKFQFSN